MEGEELDPGPVTSVFSAERVDLRDKARMVCPAPEEVIWQRDELSPAYPK